MALPVLVVPNVLTPAECQCITDYANIVDTGSFDADRDIDVAASAQLPEAFDDLMRRVLAAAKRGNKENFRFSDDLFIPEHVWVHRYDPGNKRGWHVDIADPDEVDGRGRKLTVVVQLSKPETYTGGGLEFFAYHKVVGEDAKMARQQGSMVLFPSYEFHRVNPVKSGSRYSLVMVVAGKPFA